MKTETTTSRTVEITSTYLDKLKTENRRLRDMLTDALLEVQELRDQIEAERKAALERERREASAQIAMVPGDGVYGR